MKIRVKVEVKKVEKVEVRVLLLLVQSFYVFLISLPILVERKL